jgi:hypothetical protein
LFVSLDATLIDNAVELRWDVAADEPIRGFNVCRAQNAAMQDASIIAENIAPEERTFVDNDVTPGQTYYYFIVAEVDGREVRSGDAVVAVPGLKLGLSQNYPNPFNPTTTIEYTLSQTGFVNLSIFDAHGNLVRTLEKGVREAGSQTVIWDGTDESGDVVSSGTYFYRLDVDGKILAKKLLLLK